MGFEVEILADSVVSTTGARLTTIRAKYPRSIHSEMLTHRLLSKGSASSRAIPVSRMIADINADPFIPLYIGKNQKGMQAGEELDEVGRQMAIATWIAARDQAIIHAEKLVKLGVHKQVVNRILEPWMWITTIISATEWENFFALRCHEMAEPHFQEIARMIRAAREASTPRALEPGQWHLPYVRPEDVADVFTAAGRTIQVEMETKNGQAPVIKGDDAPYVYEKLVKISVGRCARVSYLTHDGRRAIAEDLRLYDDLMTKRPLHATPAEHAACAMDKLAWSGNFYGFEQHRKMLPFERVGRAPGGPPPEFLISDELLNPKISMSDPPPAGPGRVLDIQKDKNVPPDHVLEIGPMDIDGTEPRVSVRVRSMSLFQPERLVVIEGTTDFNVINFLIGGKSQLTDVVPAAVFAPDIPSTAFDVCRPGAEVAVVVAPVKKNNRPARFHARLEGHLIKTQKKA